MIPKIIHNAWFGRAEKSDLFKRCIESWHRIHPDWDYVETTEDNIGLLHTPYLRSVLERGEFVKAAEIARLAALSRMGGVYLDADVELLKPLDPLLAETFFAAWEDASCINGAVMGSVAHGELISLLTGNFPINSFGDEPANHYGPIYITDQLRPRLLNGETITVFPPEYFYPFLWNQTAKQAVITTNTYAIHHWAKSWLPKHMR